MEIYTYIFLYTPPSFTSLVNQASHPHTLKDTASHPCSLTASHEDHASHDDVLPGEGAQAWKFMSVFSCTPHPSF